ncbi:MAG: hypothetical protein Q4A06_04855 [Cardiobacteriaceae bacterium]|nr:hypothetical protein [Cardiobacteriaceae bacterium]
MVTPEYAPRHDRKTRIRFALFWLTLAALAFAFLQFIYFPFLRDLAENGECRKIFGQPGLIVLFYASLLPMPLLLLAASLFLLPTAIRTLQSGTYPPPGRKTFRLIRIRYGRAARLHGWLMIAYIITAFATLVYAFVLTGNYAARYHAKYPDGASCIENTKK